MEVQPLVPVKASAIIGEHLKDAYYWGVEQDVVVMFVDLRNFTGITESQLAYDVVVGLPHVVDGGHLGAVVATEQDQRIFPETQLIDFFDQCP